MTRQQMTAVRYVILVINLLLVLGNLLDMYNRGQEGMIRIFQIPIWVLIVQINVAIVLSARALRKSAVTRHEGSTLDSGLLKPRQNPASAERLLILLLLSFLNHFTDDVIWFFPL